MASIRTNRGFTALRVEGGILPPEFLQSVAALEAPRQAGPDYGLSRSLAIKEELARYWRIGNDLYGSYAERRPRRDLRGRQVGIEDWLVPFLRLLGYEDLTAAGSIVLGDRVFRLSHRAYDGAVPLLLVTRDFELDKADVRLGHDGRRQAPHGLMQEYLNAEDAALWGMVSNGSKLRILRDNASLTRPSYIEADLDLIFAEELYPDFSALWLTAHASRLKPLDEKPSSCIIETWRAKAHETGERIRENLRDGVTNALRQLGNGFLGHPANIELRQSLENGALSPEQYFQQLLRLIYRLLFLFTAEERKLLHAPEATESGRTVYEEGYALSRLRERALRRRHYDRNSDLWRGLQITFGALAEGGAPALGLPALGGLFRNVQCPDLDRAALDNERLLEAVRSLTFFRSGKTLARVNYRDMGAEELGSVYESLLELQPVIDLDASPWTFAFSGDEHGEKTRGSERKLTGSYYTPTTLVTELVKSTLDPVIAQAVAASPEDPRAAVLNLRVVDPACGSGHFLLAAARRLAAEIARIEADGDGQDEAVRQHALREVVQHCIYGVDRNAFAVELCKAALWIETVEPGRPFTFLDSHILHGDSLIGVLDPDIMADGIPADAYKPLTGDDKAVCLDLKKRNRRSEQHGLFDQEAVVDVAVASLDLDAMPEDTLEDVERKRAAWKAGLDDETRARERLRANLFTGAYFAPKTRENLEIVPHSHDIDRLNSDLPARRGVEAFVEDMAKRHHFFHWHLAFADIMQDGGFDAVLGNPPWDQVQLDPREFFAHSAPSIADQPTMAARNTAIENLANINPALYADFQSAKQAMKKTQNFIHGSGRFPTTSFGRLNSAPLFAELTQQLVSNRGRVGIIVPTGIATDSFNQYFFTNLVTQQALVSLFDFENREKVFPGIDSRIKFCLLTLSGKGHPIPEAEFAFFLHQTEQLKETERRFALSANDFALFNPNTRTCPIFRTRQDMEIARKMYRRAGVFWKEGNRSQTEENPWGVKFQLMFMMNTDSHLFRTRAQLEEDDWTLKDNVFMRGAERYLPLYEAKLFHQYDHRFATFEGASERELKNGKARPMTSAEKSDPESVALPRYWVPEEEVAKRLKIAGNNLGIQNPESRIQNPESRIQNPESRIQNPESRIQNPESRIQNPESRIQNPESRIQNPESRIQNPESRIQNPESRIQNPESRIQNPESRIQNLYWIALRTIARATDLRTSIGAILTRTGQSGKAAVIRTDPGISRSD